jgi:hypothetical protein
MNGRTTPLSLTLLVFAGSLFAPSALAAGFDQTHALLTGLLSQYVKHARVDYAGLKAQPRELNQYLDQIAAVPRDDFETWTEAQQIANSQHFGYPPLFPFVPAIWSLRYCCSGLRAGWNGMYFS